MAVPLTIRPQAVLQDAIAHMSQAQASCVVVTEAGHPIGIFTEHDCVQWVARGIDITTTEIMQVIAPQLVTLSMAQMDNPLIALETMQQHGIHHLPVIDERGQLVDLVTSCSLREMLHPSDFMQLLRVGDVMATEPVTVSGEASVATVLQVMAQRMARCLVIAASPATDQPQTAPIGIVTERDIVRWHAAGLTMDTTPVHTVMSQPLLTIAPRDTLWDAHQRMQRHQVRRLAVCDPQGSLVGMITQHNIVQTMQPSEMLHIVQLLQDAVTRLQNENIELLQAKNRELEKQMRVRALLERRLRASQQQMRAVFEAMQDIVLVCDLQGDDITNIELSPTCPDQFEQPDLDPASQTVAHLWRNDGQLWTRHIRQAITEQRRVELDYHLTLGQRQVWFTASISPMSEQSVVCVARDITERKEFEQQLQQLNAELLRSNQELEQFAYVASHDLQEPLRMVISFTQLLAQRYGTQLDDEADTMIGFAVDGATRMQQLIQDLLRYARVGTGSPPPVPVDMQTVLEEVLVNLHVSIQEASAQIEVQSLPTVIGDRRQLIQLFQNLIANAIRYRRDVPLTITISAERQAQEAVLRVQDNGIGIDPQHTERIFTVFQRLHARTQYPGTGIGLAICKKIVEQQGGQIWVESELGQGSTFSVSLPIPASATEESPTLD